MGRSRYREGGRREGKLGVIGGCMGGIGCGLLSLSGGSSVSSAFEY